MTLFVSPQVATRAEVAKPAEAYIHWMRDELASGSWQADPSQPALLYKTYPAQERLPLDEHIPLRLGMSYGDVLQARSWPLRSATPASQLSWLLYYAHGLTRILRPEAGVSSLRPPVKKESGQQRARPAHFSGPRAPAAPFFGRPVPSGGSLHPTELYLALGPGWNIPPGLYHYDNVHHMLERLRAGDFTAEIAACLLSAPRSKPASAFIFTSVFYQKNHQKYTNLSYWLQTLDAGILTEQLRFVAACLQIQAVPDLRFRDAPLHHLLGLDPAEEAIYAVLGLEMSGSTRAAIPAQQAPVNGQQLCALPPLEATHLQPFVAQPRSSLLNSLYAAALLDGQEESASASHSRPALDPAEHGASLRLPDNPPLSRRDIAQVLLRRRTASNALAGAPLQLTDLSALFRALPDLPCQLLEACQYQLYCVVVRVEALPQGVYLYRKQELLPVSLGQVQPLLARISTGINIFPHLVPLNLFLCADYRPALQLYGARGLRMLGIEMGRVLQRLALAASAADLGTHIHQSFHIEGTRKGLLHQPSPSCLPLASMMVGHVQHSQGGLFESAWY